MVIIQLVAIDILFPLIIALLVYYFRRKLIFLVPVAIFLLNFIWFSRDILCRYIDYPISERIRLYFCNDSSMGIYMIHIPMVFFSLLIAIGFKIFNTYKRKAK